MRIGIGLNLLQPQNGGAGNYVLTLLRHWPRLAPEHPMVLFSFDHNEAMLASLPAECRRQEIRIHTQEDVGGHLDQFDLYFCPFGSLWPRPLPKPSVLTFHDMQERFFPENFTAAEIAERLHHYDASLQMADRVIAVSRFTRDSCTRIAGISRRKIGVIYHAPDELPQPEVPSAWPASPPERFFLFPANFWPHKNHSGLLAALRLAKEQGRPITCVLTGSSFDRNNSWQKSVLEAGVEDQVILLHRVSRAELSWLYRNAFALVFPSLFEGFGIPLIEAMSAGCPILCSGTTSLPEIGGEAALYFDPTNPESILVSMLRISTDPALRAELARRGAERSARFSPQRLVSEHLATFLAARRAYNPLKFWYRKRILEPRSINPRGEITPKERAAANFLLQASRRFADPSSP